LTTLCLPRTFCLSFRQVGNMSDAKNPVKRLLESSEEKLQDAAEELLSNPRFAEALKSVIEQGRQAKNKADRRLRFGLNLLNIPTKMDYDDLVRRVVQLGDDISRLEARLDAIIGRLENLTVKAAAKGGKK